MRLRNNLSDGLEVVQTTDAALLAMPVNLSLATVTPASPTTTLTVPIITASNYTSPNPLTLTLGALGNPTNLLIGFYLSTMADSDIAKVLPIASVTGVSVFPTSLSQSYDFGGPVNCVLLVSDNYNKTRKFAGGTLNGTEKYGTGTGTNVPLGRNYADIGAGILIGWYSVTANGVLGIAKKVQLEAAWLTQSGVNTILNLRIFNADTVSTVATPIKVAVIR